MFPFSVDLMRRDAACEIAREPQAAITEQRAIGGMSQLGEALVREDGRVLFPVEDGIPAMLIEESIELPG